MGMAGEQAAGPQHTSLRAALGTAELPHQPDSKLCLFISPRARSLDHQTCKVTKTWSPPLGQYPRSYSRNLLLLPAPSRPQLASQLEAESKSSCCCQAQPRAASRIFLCCLPCFHSPGPCVSLPSGHAHRGTACQGIHLPARAGKGQHTQKVP